MKPAHLLLLALFAAPLFVALDDSAVWDANEAFYVQTPREMLERGDWIVPYFNGRPRLNKPPLSYWIVGAFYRCFGPDLLWERLAMALLAAGSLGALYWLGRNLYDPDTALLAVGLLATAFRFLILARRLMIDVLLLFCLLMALACLVDWMRSGRGWTFLLGAVWMGLGFLAKGPLALFAVLPPVGALAAGGGLGRLRLAPWGRALLLLGLVGVPWFLWLGAREGWEAPLNFFLRENLGRYAVLDYGPRRGIFYYFGVFLADFFPWSLFFATAAVWQILSRDRRPATRTESGWLLWIWMGVWFAAFSLSHNKQEYYLVPLYPAAALWTAGQLRGRATFRIPTVLAGIVLAAGATGLYWIAGGLFPGTSLLWLPAPFLAVFAVPAWRRRWLAAAACLSLFFALGFATYLAPLEGYRPIRALAATVSRLDPGPEFDAEVGYYRFTAPSLVFYLNRPIREIYDLPEAVALLDGPKPTFLVVAESDYAELRAAAAGPLKVIQRQPAISTNAKTLLAAWRSGRPFEPEAWTRSVLLISNRGG